MGDPTGRKGTDESRVELEKRVAEELAGIFSRAPFLHMVSRQAEIRERFNHVAHRWRQPLNALSLLLANLNDASAQGRITPKYMEKTFTTGMRLVQKMNDTFNDISNFFQAEEVVVIFGVKNQAEKVLQWVAESFQRDGISIGFQVAGDFTISGLPAEFSQVFLNLVDHARNAILAAHVVPGKIEIAIGTTDRTGWVSVRDNGPGFPDGITDEIFLPSLTTGPREKGIGLFLTKLIVERRMGGKLEAGNVEGGAEFTLRLPLGSSQTKSPVPDLE